MMDTKIKRATLTLIAAAVMALTACGGGSTPEAPAAPKPADASISASVQALDLGHVKIREQGVATFTLTNATPNDVAVSAEVGTAASTFTASGCATLVARASCTMTVTFTPKDAGPVVGQLSIQAGQTTLKVSVAAVGDYASPRPLLALGTLDAGASANLLEVLPTGVFEAIGTKADKNVRVGSFDAKASLLYVLAWSGDGMKEQLVSYDITSGAAVSRIDVSSLLNNVDGMTTVSWIESLGDGRLVAVTNDGTRYGAGLAVVDPASSEVRYLGRIDASVWSAFTLVDGDLMGIDSSNSLVRLSASDGRVISKTSTPMSDCYANYCLYGLKRLSDGSLIGLSTSWGSEGADVRLVIVDPAGSKPAWSSAQLPVKTPAPFTLTVDRDAGLVSMMADGAVLSWQISNLQAAASGSAALAAPAKTALSIAGAQLFFAVTKPAGK